MTVRGVAIVTGCCHAWLAHEAGAWRCQGCGMVGLSLLVVQNALRLMQMMLVVGGTELMVLVVHHRLMVQVVMLGMVTHSLLHHAHCCGRGVYFVVGGGRVGIDDAGGGAAADIASWHEAGRGLVSYRGCHHLSYCALVGLSGGVAEA